MNPEDLPLGLAYDDVLLIPQKSRITSRKLVTTRTKFSKNIELAIPFISSNIDTVTEGNMAIVMAKLGGIGVIHRFMTIEREAAEVQKVKRSEGFVMGTPFTLFPNQTAGEAILLMKQKGVGSAVIVDENHKVLGLVADRDMWFLEDQTKTMNDLMTPASKLITARVGITVHAAKKLFRRHKVEKLPLLLPDGRLGGLITSRTVLNEDRYPSATKDRQGRLRVAAAVGVVGDYLERATELIKAGVDALVIDIAHIHSDHGLKAVKKLRGLTRRTDIIAGNIATAEAARDLVRLDVDALKVGIGPGGICITRIVAGAGVPQLTAIMEVAPLAHRTRVPLIADGGTNYQADMVKALAAGASTVMLAGWLAGTDESPGTVILRKGQKFKVHRGAASFTAVASRTVSAVTDKSVKIVSGDELDRELEEIVPEGVETFVPYKGAAKDVINQLAGAVRSGMSYCNAASIGELWRNARFMRITPAGFRESTQHNVEEM